jgi:hypothetical protein
LEDFWFTAAYLSLWLLFPPLHDLRTVLILVALTVPCHCQLCHREVYLWKAMESLLSLSAVFLFCLGSLLPPLRAGIPLALLALLSSSALVRCVAGDGPGRTGWDLRMSSTWLALSLSFAYLSLAIAFVLCEIFVLPQFLRRGSFLEIVLLLVLCIPTAAVLRWAGEPWRSTDGGARTGVARAAPFLCLGASLFLWTVFFRELCGQWR